MREMREMRWVGVMGGWGWKGNRLLALVGVGQPIVLLSESGRLWLVFYLAKFLNVNSLSHFLAVDYRWLVELLSGTKFFYDTGLFVFTFEFLKGAFDVFAFFYWNYDHNSKSFKLLLLY